MSPEQMSAHHWPTKSINILIVDHYSVIYGGLKVIDSIVLHVSAEYWCHDSTYFCPPCFLARRWVPPPRLPADACGRFAVVPQVWEC